jgi:alanyl-tRNA synthetase
MVTGSGSPAAEKRGLRLLAQDEADLRAISAALQDAVATMGDLAYDPKARSFTAVVNPFYGESGGQVGDTGLVETETGAAEVIDTQHALQGLHGHRAKIVRGFIATGQQANASIDSPRREAIRKSHTGTHVLHWAIRDVVGEHASQAGSLVEPGRLRFDFSHHSGVPAEELGEIEAEVNERLIANAPVKTEVTSKDRAREMGAIAFFGDKYGETVRVVSVGDFSVEFCGGTHTASSGQVGPLILLSESSIGANVRRVEALTGMAAFDELVRMRKDLDQVARTLKVAPAEAPARVEAILEKSLDLEKQIEAVRSRERSQLAHELAGNAAEINDYKLVVAPADLGGNELRQLAQQVGDVLGSGSVVILGSGHGGKGALVGLVSSDLVEAGLSAADLITGGAREMGGGGSRDPELSQAGGPDGHLLETAMATSKDAAEQALSRL